MPKIDVLIVDDHAVVRTGYKACLSMSEDIGKIYEAESGEAACQIFNQFKPRVVIMDLSMPGIGGFESIRRLISRDSNCKILVFSIYNELIYVNRAIKAGAKGYITKNSSPDTLIKAVCVIAADGTFVDPALAQQLAVDVASDKSNKNPLEQLSAKEFDVFCLLAKGLSTRDVAEKLRFSYKTACNHATAIKEKLGLKTLAEIPLLAWRQGLLNAPVTHDFE